MGIDRTSEEDFGMSEKKFKIGQVVRIVGPSFFGIELGVGKCFVIGDIITRDGKPVYCDTDRGIGWLASSLELAEPESDSTNPSLTGHPIEEVKRTPPEEFQNVEGARLDLSGEFTALRSVKLGGALDGCGISAELENKLNKLSPEDERMHRWVESNPTTLYHAMDGLRRFGLVRAKHVGHKVLWEVA